MAALPPGERATGTNRIGGWVDPRTGLDADVERRKILSLSGLELCSLGIPADSQSLYRLCYPEKTEVLGEDLPQCHFYQYKFHMT